MNIEFEATFLNIDKDDIRHRLKQAGAVLIYPEFLMSREVFDPPQEIKGGWLRVRKEFEKTTMSLKVVDGNKIEDQKEIELAVDDFDEAVKFLESIGAKRKSYQETLRELWKVGEVEITIDTWPGLSPLVEIESDDEQKVKETAGLLNFNYNEAHFGSVDVVYEKELGIPPDVINNHMPIITFANPPKKR